MKLAILTHRPPILYSTPFLSSSCKRFSNTQPPILPCLCSTYCPNHTAKPETPTPSNEGRRELIACLVLTAAGLCMSDDAMAVSTSRRALRASKIPESEFETLPSGLKYYDLKVGGGPEAVKGSRVAVHYVAKWKGITFMTSRQGMGVGGGTPYGFDVGQSERGSVLKGLDLGVQGMRVGGQTAHSTPGVGLRKQRSSGDPTQRHY